MAGDNLQTGVMLAAAVATADLEARALGMGKSSEFLTAWEKPTLKARERDLSAGSATSQGPDFSFLLLGFHLWKTGWQT